MSRYAAKTDVSSDRSRNEIERTLSRYGARAFSYGWDEKSDGSMFAMVGFRMHDRVVRFLVPMPNRRDRSFTHTAAKGLRRDTAAQEKAYEQACRQRWRALALVVKAKLEAVEAKIATFEEEFLAHIVLPNGRTVGEVALPEIARHYELGTTPRLLLGAGDDEPIDVEVVQ